MRGRTRLLLALAIAALFALLPGPDAATGKPYLAYLRVREWLLDATTSPLLPWVQQGRLPDLQVALRQSPPIEDQARLHRTEAEYARAARQWAAARTQAGEPTAVDATRGTLVMEVYVGTAGMRAQLPTPAGGQVRLERPFASRWSLLPVCLTIGLAMLWQRVLLALFLGGLCGGIVHAATGTFDEASVLQVTTRGLAHFVTEVLPRSLRADWHLHLTLAVVFLFATIGVVTKNGGLHGMLRWLQRRVRGPVGAQLTSLATSLVFCFDHHSSRLVVGPTMRPLCDAARVSREKLAYVVDTTAAAVVGLLVPTWLTDETELYEVPLTEVAKPDGSPYAASDAFAVFVGALPYRFYCVLGLALVVLTAVLRRELGPMLGAERRARLLGMPCADDARALAAGEAAAESPVPSAPQRAANAIGPLLVLASGTALLLVSAKARSEVALCCASGAALLAAVLSTLVQRLLPPRELLATALRPIRTLGPWLGILFLAWSLGQVCAELGTSSFLTASALGGMQSNVLPVVLFGLAGGIAFATGTSFGAIAILLPNVLVLAHRTGAEGAFAGHAAAGGTAMMLLCLAAVLEGSIFGSHCSPISETTLLSSLGTQCDPMAHVRTQAPYALLAVVASVSCGYLPMIWIGPQWWPASLAAGVVAMAAVLLRFGRDPAQAPPTSSA